MSISIKDLFGRQGIANEVISVRNSLLNHRNGLQIAQKGLREVYKTLTTPNKGEGVKRGCKPIDAIQIVVPGIAKKSVSELIPEWVAADDDATRIAEGILVQSNITYEDFPLKPWHWFYDWNFYVKLDKQYQYLMSENTYTVKNLGKPIPNVFECEWDTHFFPRWAFPQEGNRILVIGRWIYDCGHPNDKDQYRTEIHPPKAIVHFRSEAAKFERNSGPTQANQAVVYIGKKGGYFEQKINNQDYAFDLYLPPQPQNIDAEPRWNIALRTTLAPILFPPIKITPFPANAPRALRIVIPFKGVADHIEEFGAIISGGWSDPKGTETKKIRRVRVTVEEILMDANKDPRTADEWYVWIGINGRWEVFKGLSGSSRSLNFSTELLLHASDQIHITAGGFEADNVHKRLMGYDSGVSDKMVYEKSPIGEANDVARKIRDAFAAKAILSESEQNDRLDLFSKKHRADTKGTFVEKSIVLAGESYEPHYRLRYKIEQL